PSSFRGCPPDLLGDPSKFRDEAAKVAHSPTDLLGRPLDLLGQPLKSRGFAGSRCAKLTHLSPTAARILIPDDVPMAARPFVAPIVAPWSSVPDPPPPQWRRPRGASA